MIYIFVFPKMFRRTALAILCPYKVVRFLHPLAALTDTRAPGDFFPKPGEQNRVNEWKN